jgi:hypothetical protein
MKRQVSWILVTCFVSCVPATAQTVVPDVWLGPNATVQILELEKTVFPITEIKFGGAVLAGEFGTGDVTGLI